MKHAFKGVLFLIFLNVEVWFNQIKCLVKKVFVNVLTNFINLTQAKVIWEEGIYGETTSIRMACRQINGAFSRLMTDRGWAQPTVGGATSG